MDLKQKISDIFNHPPFPASSGMQKNDPKKVIDTSKISESVIVRPEEAKESNVSTDPLVDEEIFQSVDQGYFEDNFNASLFELQKLGDVRLKELIHAEKQKLMQQLTVISKKVFSVILEKRSAYIMEFNRMLELQDELDNALGFCTSSRLQMTSAKESITLGGLRLVYKFRRKQQLTGLLQSLETIKTLQETEVHIHNLISKGDFAKAIHLLSECHTVLRSFSHFTCIAQLNLKLQDTLIMAEEQLDMALSKVCQNFNAQQYERLQEAYKSLGKTQASLDQLLMHVTSAIHNGALAVVRGYVALSGQEFEKLAFKDLCKNVVPECFIPCLVDLCRSMWTLMFNFNQVMRWHLARIAETSEVNKVSEDDPASSDTSEKADDKTDGPAAVDLDQAEFVRQKLSYGKTRVWQDIQSKLRDFMMAVDVSAFRIEELLQTLDIVRRLMEVGKEFAGSQSESLQDSLRQQTISYFRSYHSSRFDELKAFLDNESWEPCPVTESFSCRSLAEFQFLDDVFYAHADFGRTDSVRERSFFDEFSDEHSPFDALHSPEDLSFYQKNGSVKSEEVDELKDNPFSHAKIVLPILSNTALSLLRLIGRYLHMMRLLQPIAYDVAICLNQLIDYYLFAVAKFFASEVLDLPSLIPNSKLPSVLRKIEEKLILKTSEPDEQGRKCKILAPSLSRTVNLSRPESMVARITAVESVVFLADQLEAFKEELKNTLPETKHAALEQFCRQVKTNAMDLRHPVFASIARIVVKKDLVLAQMSRVQWDIKEVLSQHSSYIDELLIELQSFSTRLGEALSKVAVCPEVHTLIWEHVALYANQILLEGYSNVKRCSNEGRALMQLDFRHFTMKMETLTSVRPLPGSSLVDTYIKAFYIPESSIEEWAREHTEYSEKQLHSLIQVVCQSSKRKILKFMDDKK